MPLKKLLLSLSLSSFNNEINGEKAINGFINEPPI